MMLERLVLEKEEEFSRIVTEHRVALIRYGFRRLRSLEQAEDLAAETFVVAWRRFDDAPPVEHRLFWLYRIESLLLSNVYRRQRRSKRLEVRLVGSAIESSVESQVDDYGSATLSLALEKLSRTDRELIRLRYWEELSYREMGVALDCSETAAGIRLSRARQKLKRRFLQISEQGAASIQYEEGRPSE
jgi:RNA polymerase sigma factor (sigma-70 family)